MYGVAILVAVLAVSVVLPPKIEPLNVLSDWIGPTWTSVVDTINPIDPTDYMARARRLLRTTPLIDGHNDFPFNLRQQLHNKIYDRDFRTERIGSHSDFQKMKDGMMGGQFWSVYVPCPEDLVPGVDLHDPNKPVPDLNEPSVRYVFVSFWNCHFDITHHTQKENLLHFSLLIRSPFFSRLVDRQRYPRTD